jgi:hypothetical protein
MQDSTVDTSIGKVSVWAEDHEFPDCPDNVGILTLAGEPWGVAPPAGKVQLRMDVERRRGGWQLAWGWVREGDTLFVLNPTEAAEERKQYKTLGIAGVNIRALPVRSPLRQELVQVAAKWAAAHPEAFAEERRATYLGTFEFSVERLDAMLEEMVKVRQQIRPLLSGAERMKLVTPGARDKTDQAVKALEAAISAANDAKRLFASGGVIAARQPRAH